MDVFEPILQDAIPDEQIARAQARLPSMAPVDGPWLRMDEAYAAQMVERRRLISVSHDDVYAQADAGRDAACNFLDEALAALPAGFTRYETHVSCPDGHRVKLDWDAPLLTVGEMLQQDVCILEKRGAEHVLTGAILCFPASWTLRQKIGKPLVRIHKPVHEYDEGVAKRVQRLFDGVRYGRPMWRANLLRYSDPSLYQPRPENDPRPIGGAEAKFLRSERQTVMRLKAPDAVAFVIHTCVVEDRLGQQSDEP